MDMKRRKFIAFIGGAVAMPFAVRAQQNERIRRLGVLQPWAKDAPESARVEAFLQELQQLGWTDGRNLQIEYRWETRDLQKAAMELVALSPDVILVDTTPALSSLHQATSTVPIVFAQVADPVGSGLVASLAKPGGNITGFTNFDYAIGAKWVELLKEVAPHVTRVGVIRDPTVTASIGQFASIQSAAPSFGLEVSPLGGRDARDIENTVTGFVRGSNCGLIVVATSLANNNRSLIISLAARHRLPAVYPYRSYVADGGLVSYGSDSVDPHRQAAITLIAFSKAKSPLTCQCRPQPNSNS